MDLNDERYERWAAHLLGDLSGEEARQVELEMGEFPVESAELREAFAGIASWAKAPVDDAPVDVKAILETGAQGGSAHRSSVAWRSLRWPIAAAAAALLVFSLSLASFSVTYGDATFAWGLADPSAAENRPGGTVYEALWARTRVLEQKNAELLGLVEAVALRTLQAEEQFEAVAAELRYAQRLEAESRHRDMRYLAGISGSPAWPEVRMLLAGGE